MSIGSCSRVARQRAAVALAVAVPLLIGACAGKETRRAGGDTTGGATTGAATTGGATTSAGTTAATAGGQTTSAAGAPAPGGAPGGAADAKSITPKMVALGDSIYHGQAAGGNCLTCHGPDAKGTQLAPNLSDAQWLNGDGSYGFIVNTVTHGVPTPKQHPAPMPPMGGAQLTPDQIRAVAAYVYSLSHPEVKKG